MDLQRREEGFRCKRGIETKIHVKCTYGYGIFCYCVLKHVSIVFGRTLFSNNVRATVAAETKKGDNLHIFITSYCMLIIMPVIYSVVYDTANCDL